MKTSPEQFEQFKVAFTEHAEKLQLGGYEFNFVHKRNKDNAWILSNPLEDRRVEVGLNTNVEDNSKEKLIYLGYHEAKELFLDKIDALAKARYTTEREIDEERHHIIRVLERLDIP
jgi:hypothetical protein